MALVELHHRLERQLDEASTPTAKSAAICGPELSIVVPTFNERENVAELCWFRSR